MKAAQLLLIALSLFLFAGQGVAAKPSEISKLSFNKPVLTGETDASICKEALQLANTAYVSGTSHLNDLSNISTSTGSAFLYKPSHGGRDENWADEKFFEEIPKTTIRYQRNPTTAHRLIVGQEYAGCCGYYEFIAYAPAAETEDEITKRYRDKDSKSGWRVVLRQEPGIPALLQEKVSGQMWLILRPREYGPEGDWKIYSINPEAETKKCEIEFIPPSVKMDVRKLMPVQVRMLHRTLSGIMGVDDSGTLHPVLRRSLEINNLLLNIHLRPWAVGEHAIDTRANVDQGLLQWSKESPWNRRIYYKIKRQYADAQRALEKYYRKNFYLPRTKAKTLSTYVVDILFQSYFAFPGMGSLYSHVKNNPWSDWAGSAPTAQPPAPKP